MVSNQGRQLREGPERQPQRARSVIRRFNEIREEEARRIARELHDESAQMLAAIQFALDDVARDLPLLQQARIARVACLLEQVQERLRHLSHELAPVLLSDLGLKDALSYLACGFMERYGIPVRIRFRITGPLSSSVDTAVYRVVQEAVGNACRHAAASRVRIEVRERVGLLRISVRDDGRGFDVKQFLKGERSGLGLRSILERVESLEGTARISSTPGLGTVVQAEIPLRGDLPRKPPAAELPSGQVEYADSSCAGR